MNLKLKPLCLLLIVFVLILIGVDVLLSEWLRYRISSASSIQQQQQEEGEEGREGEIDNHIKRYPNCDVPITVQGYHAMHGDPYDTFIGLGLKETRDLYHRILPVCLLNLTHVPVCERAKDAYQSRIAARLYARERSQFWVRWISSVIDLVRGTKSVIEFWNYSTEQLILDGHDDEENSNDVQVCSITDDHTEKNLWGDHCQSVCGRILRSAFRTNEFINRVIAYELESEDPLRDLEELSKKEREHKNQYHQKQRDEI